MYTFGATNPRHDIAYGTRLSSSAVLTTHRARALWMLRGDQRMLRRVRRNREIETWSCAVDVFADRLSLRRTCHSSNS